MHQKQSGVLVRRNHFLGYVQKLPLLLLGKEAWRPKCFVLREDRAVRLGLLSARVQPEGLAPMTFIAPEWK
jgi:hypothetical protein